jgi:hypothetical protein
LNIKSDFFCYLTACRFQQLLETPKSNHYERN